MIAGSERADGNSRSPPETNRVLGSATKWGSSILAAWTNNDHSRVERNRVNSIPVRVKRVVALVVVTLGRCVRMVSLQALTWCTTSAQNCLSAKLNLTRYFCFWELTWSGSWLIEATGQIPKLVDNSTIITIGHFRLHILRVLTHVRITRSVSGVCP